ncbi:MAG: hypothetical protein V3V02_04290 [Rhizobiaceae bacterium]
MFQPFTSSDEFDVRLGKEAVRKSKTTSQRTGKKVHESAEELKFTQSFSGVTMTFGVVAPPQADSDRLFQLARYQLAGFFYLMTYNTEERKGLHWPGGYMPVSGVRRSDWGNPQKTSFSAATANWSFCFGGAPTANGYYQALIKRHPSAPLWSWALEWNKMIRLYGFFGDEDLGKLVFSGFDQPKMTRPFVDGNTTYRMVTETPLTELDDDLFFSFQSPTS